MPRHTTAISMFAVCLAFALAGCGSSGIANDTAIVRPFAISLRSPGIRAHRLTATYTCDGRDVSPPLLWGAVPPTVDELAVFAVNLQGTLSVEWAMAGVDPALHHIDMGQVPRGAFLLSTTHGAKRYSICPAKGSAGRYAFAVFALPRGIRATPVLSGPTLLTALVGSAVRYRAPGGGRIDALYTRR